MPHPHPFAPRKHLGQNFLVNQRVIHKIIMSSGVLHSDTVLEVGPGLGALTLPLARAAHKVYAVEKDPRAIKSLKEKLNSEHIFNVELIEGDILEYINTIQFPSYLVIANIPYYLTSQFIRKLLSCAHKPERILLTIQKEVAERICARDKKESLLSLSVKFFADPKILFTISRGSFFPVPRVDSACIKLLPTKNARSVPEDKFFTVLKAAFSSPRKKLTSNLASGLALDKKSLENILETMGIKPSVRPEQLTITQWLSLCLEVKPPNMKK